MQASRDPVVAQADYAVANMTGANRLLIGLGWSSIVPLVWWQLALAVAHDRRQVADAERPQASDAAGQFLTPSRSERGRPKRGNQSGTNREPRSQSGARLWPVDDGVDDADGAPGIGQPLLLTRAQAAQLCQVSQEIIDEWSYLPGFPVLRRQGGHFVRIHRAALEKWLEARRRPIPSKPTRRPSPVSRRPTSDGISDGPAVRRGRR